MCAIWMRLSYPYKIIRTFRNLQHLCQLSEIILVSHPIAKARGLCLDSTATLHTDEGVQL
jgi:hypothetical protein